jgi:ketosteroid isomerase-like protein/Tol biopolymer transport system component
LELYFASDRPGGYGFDDIYVMTRATTEDDWGQPVNLGPIVNSSTADIAPCISADGLELYFCEWGEPRPGGLGEDLWVTTRATKNDEWGEPVNLATVSSSSYEFTPEISSDGLELYFESDRPGGYGLDDLYVSTRATTEDEWGTPVNLGPTINSSLWEHCPTISADGLTLFFDIDFPTGDLMVTRRATIDDNWGEPVNLGHSASDHWASDILADDSTLFFMSERFGGLGGNDLWQVPIIPVVDFNGDGKVDNADICIMAGYLYTDEPSCDIGPTPLGDGIVDVQDMLVLTEYLTEEEVDVEADITAIEEVLNQYAIGCNTGDLELYMSLHADDIVKMPPDAPATFGKEELRASAKPGFDNFTSEAVLYPEETQVDGNMGFTRGNYTLSLTPKAGGEPIFVDGKYLTICKRQADGSWKISHDCWNSNVPPAQ